MSDSDKPAFPQHPGIQCDGPPTDRHGMTLRDWFAGQALAGFAASPAALDGAWRDQTVAACAYEVADAMLEARKAKP